MGQKLALHPVNGSDHQCVDHEHILQPLWVLPQPSVELIEVYELFIGLQINIPARNVHIH